MSASSLRSIRRTARWSVTLIRPELTIGAGPSRESSRLRISELRGDVDDRHGVALGSAALARA